MLDTIRLRLYGILDTKGDTLSEIQKLHGLSNYVAPEHNELYLKILEYKGLNFSIQVHYNQEKQVWEDVDPNEFIRSENSTYLSKHYQSRDRIRFIDEGKQKEINKKINGSYRVPSSFSDVVFQIAENGSYIDFEFSIPKYLYGHSLAEFIPQQGHDLRFYEMNNILSMETQGKYLHKRLNNFIDKFFSDLCNNFEVDTLPNKKYVEIRRLDICYNQYFKNKDEALLYLEEQKKLDMRRQRKTNPNVAKSYDTSVAYTSSSGSYFKIYHKGSEYSKSDGDLKKHMEINKEYIDRLTRRMSRRHKDIYTKYKKVIWGKMEAKGKGEVFTIDDRIKGEIKGTVERIYKRIPYKVDFLKDEMDKVLRYEISLRTQFFTNLYKRQVFRTGSKKYGVKGDPHHAEAVRRYKKTKNALDSRTNNKKITYEDRQLYKDMHEWYNRRVSLVLGESFILKRYERKSGIDYNEGTGRYKISKFDYRHTLLGRRDVGRFSSFFLRKCLDHFKEVVDYYQIKTIKPYDEIMSRIHAYNAEAERNTEEFNRMNEHLTRTWDNKPVRKKNGQVVKKASQLLKQKELVEMNMKKVNATILGTIVAQLERGKSLDQIFRKLKISASQKSRYKRDLRIFGVFEQSLNTQVDISVRTDFFQYYWNTDSEFYRSKFYREPKHFNYGQYNVNPNNLPAKRAVG